jgi:DNA-3-methyladenine glycosylase II
MAKTAASRKQHEFVDRPTFSIVPVAPFRLDFTAWALRRRSQNMIDRWYGTTYRRVLPSGDVPIEVAVTQSGACDAPRLQGDP